MWFDKCRKCGNEMQRGVYAVAQLAMGQTLEFKCGGCGAMNTVWPDTVPRTRKNKVAS